MIKFKKGDKVRVVKAGITMEGHIGKIGTVVCDQISELVEFNIDLNQNDYVRCFAPSSYLQLLDKIKANSEWESLWDQSAQ